MPVRVAVQEVSKNSRPLSKGRPRATRSALECVQRLRDSEIVMYWDAALKQSSQENETYVLGFEAAVPRSGGYIVTGGGTVILVSPKSFKDFKEFPQQTDEVE